jgi:ABC-type ATPase involved in cell division
VPYFRRNLGVVFQDFRLLPNKTVFDNVAFALQVIGKSKGFIQEAVPDVLKMVGLAGKQGGSRTSCPVVSSSASRWHARSSTSRPSCWRTSPPETSTPTRAPAS